MIRALVTGGSGGLGKAIVKNLRLEGIYVWSPTREELDLSHSNFILKDNQFEIVVNCAGINPLNEFSKSLHEEVMRVNYFSPLKIIQQCLPYMIEKNVGRIVNIGSILGNLSKPERSAYSASKSALDMLSKSITSEYSKYNILSNTISPGYIKTDLTYKNNTSEQLEVISKKIPLNRLGGTEEIAELVKFLTLRNTYITGQNIIIDGGYTCVA
jgi:3-oxoacyl-[acyl-carrier protein] reductase